MIDIHRAHSLILMLFVSSSSIACSCFNIPCYFFKNEISPDHRVAHVRVLGEEMLNDGSRYAEMNPSLTVLEVIQEFNGSMNSDTLKLYNGDGAMCFRGLDPSKVGKEFVLLLRPLYPDSIKTKNLYRMDLCSNSVLWVKRKKVKGWIFKNHPCDRLQRAIEENNMLPDEEKINLVPYMMAHQRKQKMRLKKFNRLWNEHFR